MFRLTGLDASEVYVKAETIVCVRPPLPVEQPAAAVVEYTGRVFLTSETVSAIVARLGGQPRLIALTRPDGSSAQIAAGAITQVRQAPARDGGGTEITYAGRAHRVTESVQAVLLLLP
jgi:hypothetical protein